MKISDMRAIVEAADAARSSRRETKAAEGIGMLRGAMAGAVLESGIAPTVLAAKCPRLDQARIAGCESKTGPDSQVVFAAGFGHENYLEGIFRDAGYETAAVEHCPIEWKECIPAENKLNIRWVLKEQGLKTIVRGRHWQGTPDFLLWDGNTWTGIEAKSQLSNFSAAKSIVAGWPQRKHVLQCCNYMASLQQEEWMLAVGHYFYAAVDGKKYPPMVRWYRISLIGARYQMENEEGKVVALDFGPKEVLDYQELIHKHFTSKTLAPRPKWAELGPGLKAYDECNYCGSDMLNECNRYDVGKLGYEEWLERLKGKVK